MSLVIISSQFEQWWLLWVAVFKTVAQLYENFIPTHFLCLYVTDTHLYIFYMYIYI